MRWDRHVFLGNKHDQIFSDLRYGKGELMESCGVERSGWLIIFPSLSIILVSSLSLLIYSLGNSRIVSWRQKFHFLFCKSFFFPLAFKVEYSIQSSCRLFFRFPYECFLIPRLQAFVSIYQPSSYPQKQTPSPRGSQLKMFFISFSAQLQSGHDFTVWG